jgi:hypothetical protein
VAPKPKNKISGTLLHVRDILRPDDFAPERAAGEPPFRAELFSREQMEQHGRTLASSHRIGAGCAPDQLLPRLSENEVILGRIRNLLSQPIATPRRMTPAGEWLLDNFYLIVEQIRAAKKHLPRGYSRELPCLVDGPSSGLPRVYDIALETIAHGDGRVDSENLAGFVAAYQSVSPLKLGELWAIPIMLRLALIENLRRVGARLATDRLARNAADDWADRMLEIAEKDPSNLILIVADMARSNPPLGSAFVAELARRLQNQSPTLALPLSWVEQRLGTAGQTIAQLVQTEHQQQAADQVSVGNSIGSLRMLGTMDWRGFVESMSAVQAELARDPAGVHPAMDFETRDRYRHVVERVAKLSRLSEPEVAHLTVELAERAAAEHGRGDRAAHVGYYLIDDGLSLLERRAEMRRRPVDFLRMLGLRHPLFTYMSCFLAAAALGAAPLLREAAADGWRGWALGFVAVLAVLSAGHLAVALVNWLVTLSVPAHRLPRMEYSAGIPEEARTLVVVPTMLSSLDGVESLVEALEVRFLANQDPNVYFALLTDFRDAESETTPADEPLVRLARERIQALNEKYANGRGDVFFLFHRPRRWNAREGVWMGYERKRGKLGELNAFLRGGSQEAFALIAGDTSVLKEVKYVITLDTDTQLPRDAARQFVAAMAHPLNRAHYNPASERVVQGYGILQPRVAVSLPGTNRSRYARLFGSDPGIDPYTRTVSDVYQDLFREGSFIGKGIYDVDAFECSLKERFPENRILSHDLLEGCYARAGLLSDVELYEEYPPSYGADVRRRHRWMRGDWQIAPWLFRRVPGPGKRRLRSPLSGLSRWKIFDNLRRSLTPIAMALLLVTAWTSFSRPWLWTVWLLVALFLPPLLGTLVEIALKPPDIPLGPHVRAALRSGSRHLAQVAFTLACLPHEAYFALDAIARTCGRVLITRRRLLEWNPSSDAESHA